MHMHNIIHMVFTWKFQIIVWVMMMITNILCPPLPPGANPHKIFDVLEFHQKINNLAGI